MNHSFLLASIDWLLVFTGLKDFVVPITTLVFSSFAFYISFSESRRKKFNLKIDFFSLCEEWLIDRESNDLPDVYHQNKYRMIDAVLLTNNSSLPITITEFKIQGIDSKLNPYTRIGNSYSTTVVSPIKSIAPGVTAHSGGGVKKTADLETFPPIPLPITIAPYESVTTTLMFRYDEPLEGKNINIEIQSSRGVKTINRFVSLPDI